MSLQEVYQSGHAPQEGVGLGLLSPLLEVPGKCRHFVPSLHRDIHASEGCVPFEHMVIMLKHTKARGLCPVGLSSLGKQHLGQFTCHCHILCEQLGILSIPPGYHDHFFPLWWGIQHLFYSPIHPPSMMEYWIMSCLWHCHSWDRGSHMDLGWVCWQALLQSLHLGSCPELGRPISPLASMPSFSRPVCILQLAIQARRLS